MVATRSRRPGTKPSVIDEAVLEVFRRPEPPNTLGALAEHLTASPAEVGGILERPRMASHVLYFRPKLQPKTVVETPIYAPTRLDQPEVLGHVLGFALVQFRERNSVAFSPAELGGKIRGGAGRALREALSRALEQGALPPGFGALRRRTLLLFRLQDLEVPSPAARPAASDFRARFDQAFDELDRARRQLNQVKLLDLRQCLSQYDRPTFDAELRKLRLAGRYSLDPAEGTHARLNEEERAAGIVEAGLRLVYCQRVGGSSRRHR